MTVSTLEPRSIYRFLDTNGDGTGVSDAVGHYSGAVEEFYIQPAAGEVIRIRRMIVSVGDTTGMQAQEYGNLAAALTNGVTIKQEKNGAVVSDITAGVPIKTNAAWGALCFDAELKTWGAGNELLVVRFTFKRGGSVVRLVADRPTPDRLVVTVNDDLTGLLSHRFMIHGKYESILE